MQIITRYAEEKLAGLLPRIKDKATAWRCIRFTFGSFEKDPRDEVRLQIVTNLLKEQLADEDVRLFFCEDGDIFILCNGTNKAVIESVQKQLHSLFPGEGEVKNTSELYDLSIHLEPFTELINDRSNAVAENNNAEREAPKSKPKPKISEADKADILARRRHRKEPMVMLVEDDLFTLQLVANVLKDYSTVKAMDGYDAVETYMFNAPDVVFLDINLPSIDGHEVLKQIKEYDPDAYVVMLSGQTYMEDVSKAIYSGAKGFVAKPFPKEKLLNYMRLYTSERESKSA